MALNDIDSAAESFSKALVLEPNDGEHWDTGFSFPFFLSMHLFVDQVCCAFMWC